MDIKYLPDFVVNVLGVAALGFFPLIASYYLWTNDPDKRPALRTIFLAALALCLCVAALRLTGWPLTIEGVLALVRRLFTSVAWQFVGAALALVLYLSIALEAVWQGMRHRRVADFVAVGGFLLFVVLLYLPFGFDTIGHWEEWCRSRFFEGLYRQRLHTELSQRYWFLSPFGIGFILNSESFSGYNMLLPFSYGQARSVLRYPALSRCSEIVCFLDYNAIRCLSGRRRLMNLRSIALQFSILNLLSAIYLVLQYFRNPTRLHLAGVWLALALSVGAYEAQYALILVLPLLWWYRMRKARWREINLTSSGILSRLSK